MRASKAAIARVTEKILAYLSRNPEADDTLEGVAQWWLLDQMIVDQTTCIKEALAELAANGLLVENACLDGRIHYRLNPRKHEEITRWAAVRNRVVQEVLMPVRIRNRSRHLVTVELNTRETVHLAPNEVSRALEEYELLGNRQLEKLIDGGYVEQIEPQEAPADEGAKKKAGRSSSSGTR